MDGWVSNCDTPRLLDQSQGQNCSFGRSRPATVGKLLLCTYCTQWERDGGQGALTAQSAHVLCCTRCSGGSLFKQESCIALCCADSARWKRCTDYLFSLSHKRLNCRGRNVTSVFSPFPFNRIVFVENGA